MHSNDDHFTTCALLQERMKCVESTNRGRSIEENLRVWAEMQKGSEEGLSNAMRFKLDMKVQKGSTGRTAAAAHLDTFTYLLHIYVPASPRRRR